MTRRKPPTRAELVFDTTTEEGRYSLTVALNAHDILLAVNDVRRYLRSELKHGEHTKSERAMLEHIRDIIGDAVAGVPEELLV